MPNIIITKGTYDKFGALRPVFKRGVITSDGWGQERSRKTSYPV